jgi:hypothetical protein
MKTNFKNIAPTDLRDYAKSFGWQLLDKALADELYVLSHPQYPKRQLVFPINTEVLDYEDSIEISIHKLSEITHKPIAVIFSEISELKDDTLKFRILDTRNENSFIPLSYAVTAINGAKELFLSAACNVLKPQMHHPRLSKIEAWQFLEASRFRHTETGSFVLKVSSPVKSLEFQGNLYDKTIPFVRQATLAINHGLTKLVTAIQSDTLTKLIDEIKKSEKPLISSNLCKAITCFKEEHNDFELFVDFDWARELSISTDISVKKSIKIQKDYFTRIDEVRRELRNFEQKHNKEEVFIGTVEQLAGDIDNEGKRSGEVILNLYQGDDEIIKAKTSLNSEQYIKADKAHMTSGAYIRVKGKLHLGNQPRNLTNVTVFELI